MTLISLLFLLAHRDFQISGQQRDPVLSGANVHLLGLPLVESPP
jgi:hypothetical protein